MRPIYQYKMWSNVFYFVTVFYPKDGTIIKVKLCHRHSPTCLTVKLTMSWSQLSLLAQAELKGTVHPKMKIQSLSTHIHTDGRVGEVF